MLRIRDLLNECVAKPAHVQSLGPIMQRMAGQLEAAASTLLAGGHAV
jgi:hypothetical protein